MRGMEELQRNGEAPTGEEEQLNVGHHRRGRAREARAQVLGAVCHLLMPFMNLYAPSFCHNLRILVELR